MTRKGKNVVTFAIGLGCFVVGLVAGIMIDEWCAEQVKWDI